MRKPPTLKQLCEKRDQWNRNVPIGTEVEFHPVIGRTTHRMDRTVTEAWILSGHTVVVKLENEVGCVATQACVPRVPRTANETPKSE